MLGYWNSKSYKGSGSNYPSKVNLVPLGLCPSYKAFTWWSTNKKLVGALDHDPWQAMWLFHLMEYFSISELNHQQRVISFKHLTSWNKVFVNGRFRYLNWRYCTIQSHRNWWCIPLHSPYIDLIYGRYLQFWFPNLAIDYVWGDSTSQLSF